MANQAGLTFEQVHPNPVATGYVPRYGGGEVYAHPILAPERPVADPYYTYANWTFGDEILSPDYIETLWSDGNGANVIPDGALTWSEGYVKPHAVKKYIRDSERSGAISGVQLEMAKVRQVTNLLRRGQELAVYALAVATTNAHTISTKWDASGATIKADWLAMKTAFKLQCGVSPNWAVIPEDIANHLSAHSELLNLVRYTHDDLLVNGMLPRVLWGVPLVIPGVIINSANPGATASVANIWAAGVKKIWMGYSDPDARTNNEALSWALNVSNRPTPIGEEGVPEVLIETSRSTPEDLKRDEYVGYSFWDIKETASACILSATVMT